MSELLPKVYPITDVRISGLAHAEQVEFLAEGGATLIQLREKSASPREFYDAALEAIKIARSLGVRIIINDRVDIAIAVGADGVHLGQSDFPPDRARSLLGEDRIIGYSTHNLKQAMLAGSEPIDYIAVGSVFQTATKENSDPVMDLSLLNQIRRQTSKPLVAIGGITLDRAQSVIDAGADSVALISDLLASGDIANRIRAYFNLFR